MLDWIRSIFAPQTTIQDQLLIDFNRLLQQKLIEETTKAANLKAELESSINNAPETFAITRYELLKADNEENLENITRTLQIAFDDAENQLSNLFELLEEHPATYEIRTALLELMHELILKIAVCESHLAIYRLISRNALRQQCLGQYANDDNSELYAALKEFNESTCKFKEAAAPIQQIKNIVSAQAEYHIPRPDILCQCYKILDLEIPDSLQVDLDRYLYPIRFAADSVSDHSQVSDSVSQHNDEKPVIPAANLPSPRLRVSSMQ